MCLQSNDAGSSLDGKVCSRHWEIVEVVAALVGSSVGNRCRIFISIWFAWYDMTKINSNFFCKIINWNHVDSIRRTLKKSKPVQMCILFGIYNLAKLFYYHRHLPRSSFCKFTSRFLLLLFSFLSFFRFIIRAILSRSSTTRVDFHL